MGNSLLLLLPCQVVDPMADAITKHELCNIINPVS